MKKATGLFGGAPNGAAPMQNEGLIPPHGGALVVRRVPDDEREEALAKAAGLPALPLTATAYADLRCLADGVYSPLTGFMRRDDYWRVLDDMRLADGLLWPMPIVLPVPPEAVDGLTVGRFVRLVDGAGQTVGTMRVEDVFARDAEYEAMQIFRTKDASHPGVARLYGEPHVLAGGSIRWLGGDGPEDGFGHGLPEMPVQTRAEFVRRGWRRVVGFQTRNPVHRAHEYIQKCALEIVDGLLLHPLVGATKEDDVPAHIRIRSYEMLLEHYYPEERVVLAAFPAAMRYAGPREAVFHALCRKNYGCSHFIVGRDHAGVGNFYGTYDAQRIFDAFRPEELGITPLFFEHAFYCRRCGGMATSSTCAHGPEERVVLSGTAVRAMLRAGELPPPEFTRPEVARLLAEAMADVSVVE